MTRINLYPWRADTDERLKKQFIVLISAVNIVVLLVMIVISCIYYFNITAQEASNAYINEELVEMNRKLRQIEQLKSQKEALITRLTVIEEVEHDRYSTVYLFNEMANLINAWVVLKDIKRDGSLIKINGYAGSNGDVAKFLKALESSKYFNTPELNQIKVEQKAPASPNNQTVSIDSTSGLNHLFELQFYQNKPKARVDEATNIKKSKDAKDVKDVKDVNPNKENTNVDKTIK